MPEKETKKDAAAAPGAGAGALALNLLMAGHCIYEVARRYASAQQLLTMGNCSSTVGRGFTSAGNVTLWSLSLLSSPSFFLLSSSPLLQSGPSAPTASSPQPEQRLAPEP